MRSLPEIIKANNPNGITAEELTQLAKAVTYEPKLPLTDGDIAFFQALGIAIDFPVNHTQLPSNPSQ